MAPKKKTAWGDRSDSDEPPSPLAVASKKSAPDLPAIDEPGRTNPSKPGAKGGGGGGAADVAAAVQKLSAAEAHMVDWLATLAEAAVIGHQEATQQRLLRRVKHRAPHSLSLWSAIAESVPASVSFSIGPEERKNWIERVAYLTRSMKLAAANRDQFAWPYGVMCGIA